MKSDFTNAILELKQHQKQITINIGEKSGTTTRDCREDLMPMQEIWQC